MSGDPFKMDPYANGRLDEVHAMLSAIVRGHDALRDTNRELAAENAKLRRDNQTLRSKATRQRKASPIDCKPRGIHAKKKP